MFRINLEENTNIIHYTLNKGQQPIKDCNIFIKDFKSNVTMQFLVTDIEPNINYWAKPFDSEIYNLSNSKSGPILIEFYDSTGTKLIYRNIIQTKNNSKEKLPFITNFDKYKPNFLVFAKYFIDKIYKNLPIQNLNTVISMGNNAEVFSAYMKYYNKAKNIVTYNEITLDALNYDEIDLLFLQINCETDFDILKSIEYDKLLKCKNIVIEFYNNVSEKINIIINKIISVGFNYSIKTSDMKSDSNVYSHQGIIITTDKKEQETKCDFSNCTFVFKDLSLKEAENYCDNLIQQGAKFNFDTGIIFSNSKDNIQSKYQFKVIQNITDINEFIIKQLNSLINTDYIIIISKLDNLNLCNLNKAIFDYDYCRLGKNSSYRSKKLLNIIDKLLANATELYDSDDMIEIEYRRLFDLENISFFDNNFPKFNFISNIDKIEFPNKHFTASGKKIPEHGRDGFLPVLNHLYKKKNPVIIEIGSQRSYSMGDGCSTTLLGWYCKNYSGHLWTVDIDAKFSRDLIKELKLDKFVTVIEQDAIAFIQNFKEKIDFIYLDAWDWGPTDEDRRISEKMHFEFFKFAEPLLADDSIILIDDVVNNVTFDGKGKQLIPYLLAKDYELIHKSYQFLFKKKNIRVCPYCKKNNFDYISSNKKIVKCKNCSTIYAKNEISSENLIKKYQELSNPEWHLHIPQSIEEAINNVHLARFDWQEKIINLIKPTKENKPFLIDIGCGWGRFLYSMKNEHNFDVMGIELNKKNADYGYNILKINSYYQNIEDTKLPSNVDIITMFHVLEHLENPIKVLYNIINSLKDGGYFVGSVPNIESFASKKMKENWPWFESDLHRTYFDIRSLKAFFDLIGFEIIDIKTATNFNDFPINIYKDLMQIYEEPEIKKQIYFLEKNGLGEEIQFIVQKPYNIHYTKDQIKDKLFNYYDKKIADLPKRSEFNANIVTNDVNGFGDTIILTQIPKQAFESNKNISISADDKNKYFDTFIKYNDYYKNYNNDINQMINIKDFANYDWGGGHAIQRIQKALGIKVQNKPMPYINYQAPNKIENSILIHLETGSRVWHSEKMGRPVGAIINKNLDIIRNFIILNNEKYKFTEVCQYKSFLEDLKEVNIFKNKTLDELIKEVAKYEYFIGVNSGIMHLAVALGLKCIVISNFPDINDFYLPKLKYTSNDFELEWCYPQNVHLYQDGENELVKRLNILNIDRAIKGEIYPYWSDEFLDLVTEYDDKIK